MYLSEEDTIEITPEMIKAGTVVLEESGRLSEGRWSSDELLVEEIFRAMWVRRPLGCSLKGLESQQE